MVRGTGILLQLSAAEIKQIGKYGFYTRDFNFAVRCSVKVRLLHQSLFFSSVVPGNLCCQATNTGFSVKAGAAAEGISQC